VNLKSKKALILGASGKIGQSIAAALASEGAEPCLQYNHNAGQLSDAVTQIKNSGVNCSILQANLSTQQGLQGLVNDYNQQFGKLDILVNCIGDFLQKPLQELTVNQFKAIMDSNLNIAYALAQGFLPLLRQGGGRILFFGYASATTLEAKPSILPYHIAKLGLVLLTKALAQTEAANNILVNCLSPGIVESSKFWPEGKLPLGRPAKLNEISQAALFLIKSDYITGQNLEIDGGWRGKY
jgi:3-oxoacyl-[acyl-carrier protein] reductase